MALSPSSEPVVFGNAANAALTAIVAVGWITIPSTTVDTIATAVGIVLAAIVTKVTRQKVTPVATLPPAITPLPLETSVTSVSTDATVTPAPPAVPGD